MKIKNTKDDESQLLKVLIYGESGAGKTTLAKTLIGKTLIISAESGLLSLKGSEIDYVDLARDDEGKTINDPSQRMARLSEVFKSLEAGGKYQNLFLDSITEIGELVVQSLQREFPDRKDSMVLWGENYKRMRSIIKSFRDLPINVYMTCLSSIDKDESNKRYIGLSLAGQISDKAPQYFDEVFYLYVDADGKRHIITNRSEKLLLPKDRSGRLSPMEPADLGFIASKIIIPENPRAK